MQGSAKVKKLHGAVATDAQKYIASMFEVHSEVGQLRDNLREQHRIWLDFYIAVFHVGPTCPSHGRVCHLYLRMSWSTLWLLRTLSCAFIVLPLLPAQDPATSCSFA